MDSRTPRIVVNLTTEDGELLDRFVVTGKGPTLRPGEIQLSRDVRNNIEYVFNTEDING